MDLAATAVDNDASLDWMRQIQTQQRRCDEENGVLRGLYKRAKAAGENVKSMRATIRATKMDPTEVRQDMKDQIRLMTLRKLPVTPADLFDGLDLNVTEKTRQSDDIWDAEESGYRSGRYGAKIDECPYEPGSELFAAWQSWWQKGQEAIARELGPDGKQASAAKERPKRRQERIPGTEPKQAAPEKPGMPSRRKQKVGDAPRRRRADAAREVSSATH